MIRAGDSLTFTVNGTTGEWVPRTVAGVRQEAIDGLTPFFDVASVNIASDSFASDPVHYVTNWAYTAAVRATVRADYADVRDVDSIVAHAFYDATGDLPTVTANDHEEGQSAPSTTRGVSLTTLITLGVVGLIAVAVISVES